MEGGNEVFIKFFYYVRLLKTDPKARYQGYTFFFKEGFCWIFTLNESSEYQKVRIKERTVNDVNAMALYPFSDCNNLLKYFICLLNSYTIFHYKRNFVSSNSAFQINDARQLPIVIPDDKSLSEFQSLFDEAITIKKQQYAGLILNKQAEKELDRIQKIVDEKVKYLYKI